MQEYFAKVTRYWMEEIGIDGWRLDVANEVPHWYWEKWRELVKSINPEAYTVGEIWGDGTPWLQGNNFDAVMNYVFRDHVVHFFAERKIKPSHFHREITELLSRHPTTVNLAMFNLFGKSRHSTHPHGGGRRRLPGETSDRVSDVLCGGAGHLLRR